MNFIEGWKYIKIFLKHPEISLKCHAYKMLLEQCSVFKHEQEWQDQEDIGKLPTHF